MRRMRTNRFPREVKVTKARRLLLSREPWSGTFPSLSTPHRRLSQAEPLSLCLRYAPYVLVLFT